MCHDNRFRFFKFPYFRKSLNQIYFNEKLSWQVDIDRNSNEFSNKFTVFFNELYNTNNYFTVIFFMNETDSCQDVSSNFEIKIKEVNMKSSDNLLLEIYSVTIGDISFGLSRKTPVNKKRKSKRSSARSKQATINRKMTWF